MSDAAQPAHGVRREALLLCLTLGVVALAYSRSFSGPFVWDDHALIEDEASFRERPGLSGYLGRTFWSDPLSPEKRGFYRPLTAMSYAADFSLWNGRSDGFHLTNVLLHLLNCALVFALARRLGAAPNAAAIASGLFGLFPRLTESVCWISGRTDLLAGAAALSTLLLFSDAPGRHGRRTLSAAALFVGLLSKEVAIAAYAALCASTALDAYRARTWAPTAALRLLPSTLAVSLYLALRFRAQGGGAGATGVGLYAFSFSQRLVLSLQAAGKYALMLVDPLRPQLRLGALGVVSGREVAIGTAIALGALVLLGWAVKGWRPMSVGVLVFALSALGLVLHLIPIALDVLAADRFLYVPLSGLVPLAVVGAQALPRARTGLTALSGVALLAFGWSTHARTLDWADELRLWERATVDAPPGNGFTWVGLGDTLMSRDRPREALAAYRRALQLESEGDTVRMGHPTVPGAVRAFIEGDIALCLEAQGDFEGAELILRRLMDDHPGHPRYRYNHALLLLRRLDFEGADRELGEDPLDTKLRALIGKSRAHWATLPKDDLDAQGVAERARFFDELGNRAMVIRLWQRALELAPASLDIVRPAAGYLALRGDLPQAESALIQLEKAGGTPAELATLRQLLAERWPERRPQP